MICNESVAWHAYAFEAKIQCVTNLMEILVIADILALVKGDKCDRLDAVENYQQNRLYTRHRTTVFLR